MTPITLPPIVLTTFTAPGRHRVVIHAPSTDYVDGSPDYTPGAAGDPVACIVSLSDNTTAYNLPAPDGKTRGSITFDARPVPDITAPQQQIVWTVNQHGTLSPTVTLRSEGAARPPNDKSDQWAVSVVMID